MYNKDTKNGKEPPIMGMSASQARFLCLTARKNNVEFEGQQINQQRTTLSNESGSYYSELCNMVVPTPPSIDDYTKVSYTFDDGALTNTITTMIAKGGDNYSISYIQQWQDDYAIVSAASSVIAKNGSAPNATYTLGSTELRKLGSYTQAFAEKDPYLKTLSADQLQDLMKQEQYYQSMLNEKNGTGSSAYYVRYVKDSNSGAYVPYFYDSTDVENDRNYINDMSTSINCYTVGSAVKTKEVLNQEGVVEKDSSGRYLAITLFEDIVDPVTGQVTKKQTSYPLTTNTSTDEDAYNDAMNKYNYELHQYDQKVQEINSKIEIIQQQDKSLELELKHLDTEENAISTELEAVKKVISKNVDTSFKTFNA